MVRSDEDLLVIRVKRKESFGKRKEFSRKIWSEENKLLPLQSQLKNGGSAKRGGAQVAKGAKEDESVSVTRLFLRRIWSEENKLLPLQSLPQRMGRPKNGSAAARGLLRKKES